MKKALFSLWFSKYLKNSLTIIIIKIDRNHVVQNRLIENRKFIPKNLVPKDVYGIKTIFSTLLKLS